MWGEDAEGALQVGWYASGANAGAIVAGAGSVILNASGVYLDVGTGTVNKVNWQSGGDVLGEIYTYVPAATYEARMVLTTEVGSTTAEAWIYLDGDTGNAPVVTLSAGGTNTLQLNTSNAQLVKGLYINESANANQALGLTINQAANNDQIMAFKSSDVGHGATSIAETDTYGFMQKTGSASGGLLIGGLKDADEGAGGAVSIYGYLAENPDTTKDATATAIVQVFGLQTSGANVTDTVADGNVFCVSTRRSSAYVTLFIIDEDGDFFTDNGHTEYDEYDDALMAGDLAHALSGNYDKIIAHSRETLEAAGIIGPEDGNGRFMVSNKGVTALTLGALGQLWEKCRRYERALQRIDPKLLADVG